MNYQETLSQLATKHQHRQPGSPDAAAVIEQLKTFTATWNVSSHSVKGVVYRFHKSLWLMIAIGVLTFLIGFFIPLISLSGSIILGVLLFRELSHPWLGKTQNQPSENLLIDLPAKNKEVQKVFLVASYDTEIFMKTPFALKPELFSAAIFGIFAAMIIASALYLFKSATVYNFLNLFFLIIIAIINLSVKQPNSKPTALKNCAALLETAAILEKYKPDITSVTLCFTGSKSLNSGITALIPEFSKGPKDLTYVVNLVESADASAATLQYLSGEGLLPAKPASSSLIGLLQEVAQEKALTLTPAKTTEYTETYPFNRAKIQPISIVIPPGENVNLRTVRELLCGLIRKLDH